MYSLTIYVFTYHLCIHLSFMYSLFIYVFTYHLRIQQLSFILTTKHHLNKVNKIFSLWIVDGIKLKK